MSRGRRTSFGPVVLTGLAAAALATVGAGRTWATATTMAQGRRTVAAAGTDVAPAALPLALVALAAWGAVLVLRARGRRAVAGLGFLAAGSAGAAVLLGASGATDAARDLVGDASDAVVSTTAWPVVTVVACAVAVAAFLVAALRAPQWPEMSTRYDAPGDRSEESADMSHAELWRSLDQGHDPTT